MKRILLLTLVCTTLFATQTFAQFPGCPAVSTATNVTIPCGQTCTNLFANAFAGAQTTSYSVGSIPYAPPFPFNTGTQIIVNTDDVWSSVINLPFPFCFFGNNYSSIVVGSNGVCSFKTTNAGAFCSWQIPGNIPSATPADMTNSIMGPWQDIDPTNSGQVFYEIGGTAPCRYFKVSWYNVPYYGAANSVSTGSCPGQNLRATQQIILYETTNVIDMYIQQKQTCAAWNSGRAIQGIQNAAGTVAYVVTGRNGTDPNWTANNDAKRFTPAGAPNYTIAWFQGGNQIGTGSNINVCPNGTTTYTAQATYNSCGQQVVVTSDVTVGFSGVAINIDSIHQISCAGGSDGAVYASYNTGSSVLSYGWSPGGAGQTHLDGIPAGTYVFSVTDAANCTRYDTVTLVDPPVLTVSAPDETITSCNANPTTSLTATPAGGTPGYTYSWTGGGNTQTITVGAGTYTATVTDANGCTASDAGTVSVVPSSIAFNQPVITDASCAGNDGSIVVSTSGAVQPVTYTWSNSLPNGDTQTGLGGGTYTVTATDAAGCTATASYTVGQAPAVSFNAPVITDATCGATNGTITVSLVNATNPVNYSWSNGLLNSDTQTGLAGGTYDVTATDANGCSVSASYTVGQTGSISFDAPLIEDATCSGNDGQIEVIVIGATNPVTYSWSNGLPDSESQSGLAPGSYCVTATDANVCTASACYTVGQTPPISFAAPVITDATCAGNDGSIVVSVTGATNPVTYTWSNGLPNGDTQTGLAAGAYTVTAVDANNCSATASYTVGQSASFTFGTPTVTDASCGGNNGSISVTVNGATNPVTYTWSNGLPNSDTQTGLGSGTYCVTATDANTCTASACYTVGQGTSSLSFGAPVITDASCAANDGSIVVTVNGGTAPINFNWASGLPNNDTVTGLNAGNYSVTATDANGCSASASYNVAQGTSIVITNAVVNDVSCSGGGSITITATGGSGALTYTWNGGLTGNPITNLNAGTYQLTITDPSGCSTTATYIVGTSPCGDCPAVSTNNNVTIPCGQTCANLTATAVAGYQTTAYTGAPIAYNPASAFNVGTPIIVNTDDVWSGAIALPFSFCFFGNTYNQLYVGSNGVIGFNAPPLFNANSWQINNGIPSATPGDLTNCIMGPWHDMDPTNQGQIRYSITGTYPCRQFIISWYQVPMYGDPNSVSPGSCTAQFETQQIALYETTNVIEIYIQNKTICAGWNNGRAIEGIQNANGTVAYVVPGRNATQWTAQNDAYRFTPSGAPNYVINWFQNGTPIGTGDNITVCPANTTTYTVQATYTNCNGSTIIVSDSVLVNVQGGLTATIDSFFDPSCAGNDGRVYASYTSTGGTVTSYGWSPGGAGQTSMTGLSAGTYVFTVTNSAGCTASDTAILKAPPTLSVSVPDTTVYNCTAGAISVDLTATPSGGTPGYTYQWNNQAQTQTITVGVGTYTVTATDANGCTASDAGTVTLTIANPTFNQPAVTDVTCNGGTDGSITVSVSQATPPITYTWSGGLPNGDTQTGLGAGTYSVTATDANGCTGSATYDISEPAAITLGNPIITDATCTQGGTITVTATGGTGTLTYGWSNGDTGTTADSLSAGSYTLTVTDANGCSTTASYTVNAAPNSVTFGTPTIVDVTCNGGNDGSITVTATGGSGTITYVWSNGQTTTAITGLTSGSYCVTATDGAGCSASTCYTVNEPSAIALGNPTINPATCAQGGDVTVTAAGGNGTLIYAWSNGDTGTTADSIAGGTTVTLTVTDANGCSVTASYTVPDQTGVAFGNSIVTDISCNGAGDGSIHVVVNTAITPLVYTWSPNVSTDSLATGLSAGTYSVTISDIDFVCSATATFTIAEPAVITLGTPTIVDATCTQTGSITANASGGTGTLTYSWSGPSGSLSGNPITGLSGGTYNLTVIDANQCSATASYTVAATGNAISFGTPTITSPACNGGNGSITVTTTGGTGTIGYTWNPNNSTTATITGSAGTYTVTASDNSGCSASASYTITEPSAISLGQAVVNPVTCNSGGSVQVFPSGGTGTVTLQWSNGDTGNTADSLQAGTVTVTATDANGCSATASYNVTTSAGTLVFGTPVINNVSCNGANDGSITVSATGGTGSITYTWTNPAQVGATITGLAPGSYTVVASDQGGCTVNATYPITEPAVLDVTINATPLLCFGSTSGTATAVVTGGTGAITYNWNPNTSTSATISNLPVGIVLVTVTDANGCTAGDSYIIGQSPSLSYNSQINQPNCATIGFGTWILTPRGGTGEITITVAQLGIDSTVSMIGADTALTIAGVPTGCYDFTLTDSLGCSIEGNFCVNAGAATQAFDVNTDSTSCYGEQFSDGAINVTPLTLANAPYTYSLNGGAFQSDSSFTGLTAGTYTVVIKNTYGCDTTLTVVVEQPAQLFVNATPDTIVTGPGVSNQITVTIQNYSNPVYTWSPVEGLSCTDCANPTAAVNANTVFYVVVSQDSSLRCLASDSIVIIVNGQLKMPNAFSPNGDGKNDVFGPVGYGENTALTVTAFRIYNRWGEMVHNSTENWDGKLDGKDQPAGTYIYYISVTTPDENNPGTDKVVQDQGAFTLLR